MSISTIQVSSVFDHQKQQGAPQPKRGNPSRRRRRHRHYRRCSDRNHRRPRNNTTPTSSRTVDGAASRTDRNPRILPSPSRAHPRIGNTGSTVAWHHRRRPRGAPAETCPTRRARMRSREPTTTRKAGMTAMMARRWRRGRPRRSRRPAARGALSCRSRSSWRRTPPC